MPSIIKQVLWLLKKFGRAGLRNAEYYTANPKELLDLYEDLIAYARENPLTFALTSLGEKAKHYIANPLEAPRDLIAYARENPWKFTFACLAISLGIVSIVLPPAIGFAAAGPVLGSIAAGWQSSIGTVAAGSAFAVIQSMAMTGAFTAIGGTLIGIGTAIPLIGGWFGSNTPGPGDSFAHLMSSLDAERILLLTAGPDAVLRITGMKPKPGWFLESRHSKIDAAESSGKGAERRTLTTNSKETRDMLWDRMDAWRDGVMKEYALERFDVRIVLAKPTKCRGEDGFCEMFTDHEADCHPGCWCVGDLDAV